jgi:hypothetical protein
VQLREWLERQASKSERAGQCLAELGAEHVAAYMVSMQQLRIKTPKETVDASASHGPASEVADVTGAYAIRSSPAISDDGVTGAENSCCSPQSVKSSLEDSPLAILCSTKSPFVKERAVVPGIWCQTPSAGAMMALVPFCDGMWAFTVRLEDKMPPRRACKIFLNITYCETLLATPVCAVQIATWTHDLFFTSVPEPGESGPDYNSSSLYRPEILLAFRWQASRVLRVQLLLPAMQSCIRLLRDRAEDLALGDNPTAVAGFGSRQVCLQPPALRGQLPMVTLAPVALTAALLGAPVMAVQLVLVLPWVYCWEY